jgi:uncharacterized protein (UPF0303 family)
MLQQVITETVTKCGKTMKNIKNKDSWKIRIQTKISIWRKELSILAELGTGSDNIKLLNIKNKHVLEM